MYLDITFLILVVIASGIITLTLYEYSKSLVGNLLIYSLAGTLFLGAIRLFFSLSESNVLPITHATRMLCWHLMFYLTITTFLISTRALVKVVDIKTTKSLINPLLICLFLGALILGIFFIAVPINNYVTTYFANSIWDRSGLYHFIAFAFAISVSYYLIIINKKYSGNINAISKPLLIAMAFLSLIHLIELLFESWHIMEIDEELIEDIEKYLWIPVFLSIIYGFIRLRHALKSTLTT
jgi:hypothetical protein